MQKNILTLEKLEGKTVELMNLKNIRGGEQNSSCYTAGFPRTCGDSDGPDGTIVETCL